MSEDFLVKEYFALEDIVKDFDKRLFTVKGWGVTLSLAALGFGFQFQHYGFFLVAAVSGIGFWAIESATKKHQMRFYVRMREIEVLAYDRKPVDSSQIVTPQIDWSWAIAPEYFRGKLHDAPPRPKRYEKFPYDLMVLIYPHVIFPHVISVLVGSVLLILGINGVLGMHL
jgi:hypothetical protein